jgi:hypothetical protein
MHVTLGIFCLVVGFLLAVLSPRIGRIPMSMGDSVESLVSSSRDHENPPRLLAALVSIVVGLGLVYAGTLLLAS